MIFRETSIKELEKAAIARNPDLALKLQPGLSEPRVKRVLDRAKITGDLAPVVALYTWKNGTDLSLASNVSSKRALDAEKAKMRFFPRNPYYFPPLEMTAGHFSALSEIARNYPNILEAVGHCFPLFWNGSTGHLAIDVAPSTGNRVLIVDHRSDDGVREAYSSFEEFLEDAILACKENRGLRCFQTL